MNKPSFLPRPGALALLLLCASASALDWQVQIRNGKQQAVSDVAVVLRALDAQAIGDVKAGMIDQINKEFVPYVSVVQAGAAVRFPNKDNIRHHVYSISPTNPFELKLYSGTPSQPVTFSKPGLVTLGCNIHDSMLAYVWVVESPYFAVSDSKGLAHIEVPAGNYELSLWHPDQRQAVPVQTLKIVAPGLAPIDAEIDVKIRPSKPRKTYR